MHQCVGNAHPGGNCTTVLRCRAHSGIGYRLICMGPPQQQTLHGTATRDAMAEQPRGKDACVVQDEHIPGYEY